MKLIAAIRSFLSDLIYKIDTAYGVVLACTLLMPIGLYALYRTVIGISFETPVSFSASGYEIMPGNPDYAEPVSVSVDGFFYKMPFGRDHFAGKLAISGYEPWDTFDRYVIDQETYDIYIDLEDKSQPRFFNIYFQDQSGERSADISYKKHDNRLYFQYIGFDEDFDTLIADVHTRIGDKFRYYIVAPAESPEMATATAARMLIPDGNWGDNYEHALKNNRHLLAEQDE